MGRLKYACPEEKHPILELIEKNGDSAAAIRAGVGALISDIEECALVEGGKVVEEGQQIEEGEQVEEAKARISRLFRTQTVVFKRVPYGLYDSHLKEDQEETTYRAAGNGWQTHASHEGPGQEEFGGPYRLAGQGLLDWFLGK